MITIIFITACSTSEPTKLLIAPPLAMAPPPAPIEVSVQPNLVGVRYIKNLAVKIEDTRPKEQAVYPTTVILMNNKILSGDSWFNINLTVRAKNFAMCNGWLRLHPQTKEDDRNTDAPDAQKIYNYMLVKSFDSQSLNNCNHLINNYNYDEANAELTKIFNSLHSKNSLSINDSPYLVLYESQSSPLSSMILPLGDLSAKEIAVLVADWENLISKAYSIGTPFDPYIGLATLIKNNPNIDAAKRENLLENFIITAYVGTCAASITPPFSLSTLISIPSCQQAYKEIKEKLGYGNT